MQYLHRSNRMDVIKISVKDKKLRKVFRMDEYICACVYVCDYVCMHENTYMCAYVVVRGWWQVSSSVPPHFIYLFIYFF